MGIRFEAPWHRQSYERFVRESLPKLLAERMPLIGYAVEELGQRQCVLRLSLGTARGEVNVEYHLPAQDDAGIFEIDGVRRVVVPVASSEALDVGEIKCVGELLYELVAERLG